ncbi:hypothetical protein, partial [Thermoplasma sp.]|uniref:hypothetical protein n=1 Tax=Thermoplasma sp. TaxID=1973142 RepID=UPI00260E2C1A
MKAIVLDDFWVKSGTQVLASDVIKVLNDIGYEVDVLTNKSSKFIPEGVRNIIYLDHPKREQKSRKDILYNIRSLRKQISDFDFTSYDISFNNRPNIYL